MGVKGKRVHMETFTIITTLMTRHYSSLSWTTTYALETVVCITNDFEHEVTSQVYNYML